MAGRRPNAIGTVIELLKLKQSQVDSADDFRFALVDSANGL